MSRFWQAVFLVTILGCGGDGEDFEFNPMAPTNRTLSSIAPSQRNDFYTTAPQFTIDSSKTYVATVHTRRGDIIIELDAQNAPRHTNNFVFLAEQGFYDGLRFHRVEEDFVVQGGDPLGSGSGGPGYVIPAEVGLNHDQGVVAAARLSDASNPQRDSSGSQYYITLEPQPHLDGEYSVFGKVVSGFDVVQQMQAGDLMVWIEIQ